MNLENFLINANTHGQLCRAIFKVLNCNLLWVIKLDNNELKMLATDKFILEHYWDNKYYLQDPSLQESLKEDRQQTDEGEPVWKVTLGREYDIFKNSGFLYDLYKMFDIEEFVSIEKRTDSELYCFRFFTRNNRYVFMNKLIKNMPIIKCFINAMIEKFKLTLHNQPAISIAGLK